jgi:DNA-binding CsgD family transcriptional regulator
MAAWEALMLGSAGRTGPAARILDALEARGEQRIQLEVMLVRIALHIRSGHWDRAQALHRQVLAQGPAQPLATAFHAFLASVLARGAGGADLVAAAQALLTASEPVLDDPADEDQDRLAVRLVARCNVLLAQGRPADAADAVRELLDDVRRTGRIGNLVKGGADHVAVLLEDPSAPADAHRQAGEVTEMLRRMDRRLSTPVSRLHVAYAEALLADDPGAFAAAAADPVLDTVRDVAGPLLERAAACAARHDRPEQALSALRAALDLYESLPAPASAARVRAALRGAGVRVGPRGPRPARPTAGLGSLTPAERRVALLVADGLTNQAVADRLHVSRGTVATQLASAFRKLGVRGRVELALAVAELAPGPPDPDRP